VRYSGRPDSAKQREWPGPGGGSGEEKGGSVRIGQSSRAQIQTLKFKSCFLSAQVSIGSYFLCL